MGAGVGGGGHPQPNQGMQATAYSFRFQPRLSASVRLLTGHP